DYYCSLYMRSGFSVF
nr:immunoglobulin light chain junction region [Macaca mulatta]